MAARREAGETRPAIPSQHWARQAACVSAPTAVNRRYHGLERPLSQCITLGSVVWDILAFNTLFAIARLNESPLSLERSDVGASEPLGRFVERCTPGREPLDEALIDGLVFPVQFLPVGRWNALVAIDQPRQVDG